MNLEKFEESIASFDRAIQLNGNNPQAYFMRGRAKLALKQDGCEDLETALKLGHPNAVEALNQLCIN